jgi:methyl-accepting chemotaxis protein
MSFPPVWRSRERGEGEHDVYARETTSGDVAAGRAGSVGDFLVLRPGFGSAQWWPRDVFHANYERVDVPQAGALLDPSHAAEVEQLEERETPAAADPLEQLKDFARRGMAAQSAINDAGGSPTNDPDAERLLEKLGALRDAVNEHLASMTAQLEPVCERLDALEALDLPAALERIREDVATVSQQVGAMVTEFHDFRIDLSATSPTSPSAAEVLDARVRSLEQQHDAGGAIASALEQLAAVGRRVSSIESSVAAAFDMLGVSVTFGPGGVVSRISGICDASVDAPAGHK